MNNDNLCTPTHPNKHLHNCNSYSNYVWKDFFFFQLIWCSRVLPYQTISTGSLIAYIIILIKLYTSLTENPSLKHWITSTYQPQLLLQFLNRPPSSYINLIVPIWFFHGHYLIPFYPGRDFIICRNPDLHPIVIYLHPNASRLHPIISRSKNCI